jgi:hypothetical protein
MKKQERKITMCKRQGEAKNLNHLRRLLVGLALILCAQSRAAETGYDDWIRFGGADSLEAHQAVKTANVKTEMLTTSIGAIKETWPALNVSGKDESVTFHLNADKSEKGAVLEIQEIHNRRQDAFGYTVSINGKPVYFRTFQEQAAGPIHYFIAIAPGLMNGNKNLEIAIRSESAAPFSLCQAWLYTDFFNGIAKREKIFTKLKLLGSYPDRTEDNLDCLELGGTLVDVPYISPAESKVRVQKGLKMIADTGRTRQFVFAGVSWASRPLGPDGEGGFFQDMKYGQRIYHPGTDSFRPMYPNIWGGGGGMGASFANPKLLESLNETSGEVARDMRDQYSFLMAAGQLPDKPFYICRELGLQYVPGGDFAPDVVTRARADGITLDPRDGMSKEEAVWLYNVIAKVFADMDAEMAASFKRNPVVVDNGKVKLPTWQLLDNIFAHTDTNCISCLRDEQWRGWQTGVQKYSFASGEMCFGGPFQEYITARGKGGFVNMVGETTKKRKGFKQLHDNYYQRGYEMLVYYTGKSDDQEAVAMMRAADKIGDDPAEAAPHFTPYCFNPTRQELLQGTHVVKTDNLQVITAIPDHGGDKLMVKDVAKPGLLVYRLANLGEAFPSDLEMELFGRISKGDNRIEISAGDAPDKLAVVKTLTNSDLPDSVGWSPLQSTDTKFKLDYPVKGKKEIYLGLLFHTALEPDAIFLAGSTNLLRVGFTWGDKQSGQLDGSNFTKRELRTLNLWKIERAMAARQLEHYREMGGEDELWKKAQDLFTHGFYADSRQTLIGEYSQLLPARYAVKGGGKLGRWPVEVKLPNADDVTLIDIEKISGDEFVFRINAQKALTCTLALADLVGNSAYALENLGENRFRIGRGQGVVFHTDAAGKLSVELNVHPAKKTLLPLPRQLTALYLNGVKGKNMQVLMHQRELGQENGTRTVPVAANARIRRIPDGDSLGKEHDGENIWPSKNDQVQLTLNDKGEIIDIVASYGYVKGKIARYIDAVFSETPCEGIIELDNGRQYQLEFSTKCDTFMLSGGNIASFYELRTLNEAFRPGEEIELHYSPYTVLGKPPRIKELKQAYANIFRVWYPETKGDEWKTRTVEFKDVIVAPVQPEPKYLQKQWEAMLMRPTKPFEPGYVVYKVESEQPLGRTALKFFARIYEESSRISFSVSDDGKSWTPVGKFGTNWQNHYSINKQFPPFHNIEVTEQVRGKRSFFVKAELVMNGDDGRYCFANLLINTISGK